MEYRRRLFGGEEMSREVFRGCGGQVFGTLLGPGATTAPSCFLVGVGGVLFVSGFPRMIELPVCGAFLVSVPCGGGCWVGAAGVGLVCGWGCCLRTT